MATPHIESKEDQIAPKVLMPGDPMRAKYIADNFLENAVCVNDVRGMLGYTGTYKNTPVTVFASGMGGASIGIYAYELYNFYGVEEIIRLGTSGSTSRNVKVKDLVIAKEAYTLSSYPKLFFDDDNKLFPASTRVTEKLVEQAENKESSINIGTIITSDIFDVYVDKERYMKNYPENLNSLACEMEAAVLFAIAKNLGKEAGCILTVVDSEYEDVIISSEDRETALNQMIEISLDAIVA